MSKKEKKSMLLYGDFVAGHTGFATVTRNLARQFATNYEIDQLAINFNDSDYVRVPYLNYYRSVMSRSMGNDGDVYGIESKALQRALTGLKSATGQGFKQYYDVLFFVQDLFVFQKFAPDLKKLKEEQIKQGLTPTKVVYYCPIDGHFLPEWFQDIDAADELITFSKYGKAQGLEDLERLQGMLTKIRQLYDKQHVDKRITDEAHKRQIASLNHFESQFKAAKTTFDNSKEIYHGTDTNTFYPLPHNESEKFRKQHFEHKADSFIITCVNRNQPRKDIGRLMEIFAAFKETEPDVFLYLHMSGNDRKGIDIFAFAEILGLIQGEDFATIETFGGNFSMYTPKMLNQIYNASDVHISTTLGEGWGLTTTESMAAGCLTILPDNTTAREILGDNERGLIYGVEKYASKVERGDFSRMRKRPHLDRALEALQRAKHMSDKDYLTTINKAVQWCKDYTWVKQAKKFKL